ncbi:GH3 auxin-responsive promoter family protein [Fusibacter bizertensis]|uniref:GH3 auxin-responsive promoter family protein n=1 Tax=Fusibacter bizertensis TaxID=1488331 RepID=A0ABT6NF39_9FIRM|nr:GH3 auxin-responsive promoter family protein [Fusibacter bizertensis]MDH8679016.1 GH3 auxin-responsive promoter family protein [Fusibacter bizertensis]
MNLENILKHKSKSEVWNEYCWFLNIGIEEFMDIQFRLMEEQMNIWLKSGIGKIFLNDKQFVSVNEFREKMPLTRYDDYATLLESKDPRLLPSEPILWIQTTRDGARGTNKYAPYSKGMLETFQKNAIACLLISTSNDKNSFDVKAGDKVLYALAPLPYATGLMPVLFGNEIHLEYLPDVKTAQSMGFRERNKEGFKLALKSNVDFLFGLGSVVYSISQDFTSYLMNSSSKNSSVFSFKPSMLYKMLNAKRKNKKNGTQIYPKDIFDLKGFMIAGTDNKYYKDELEKMWGIRPLELFAGTEPTLIGTETNSRNGLVFFPDACFYEFISIDEREKESNTYGYSPKTVLFNELTEGEIYEIVISVFKGGAFVRYRVGDLYKCLSNPIGKQTLPKMEYIDRVTDVIDIGGFTRITCEGVEEILTLSGIRYEGWIISKELSESGKPFLHLYLELKKDYSTSRIVNREILKTIVSVFLKFIDQDYDNLKKITGVDPLHVSILQIGSFDAYSSKFKRNLRKINPARMDIENLLNILKDRR